MPRTKNIPRGALSANADARDTRRANKDIIINLKAPADQSFYLCNLVHIILLKIINAPSKSILLAV